MDGNKKMRLFCGQNVRSETENPFLAAFKKLAIRLLATEYEKKSRIKCERLKETEIVLVFKIENFVRENRLRKTQCTAKAC